MFIWLCTSFFMYFNVCYTTRGNDSVNVSSNTSWTHEHFIHGMYIQVFPGHMNISSMACISKYFLEAWTFHSWHVFSWGMNISPMACISKYFLEACTFHLWHVYPSISLRHEHFTHGMYIQVFPWGMNISPMACISKHFIEAWTFHPCHVYPSISRTHEHFTHGMYIQVFPWHIEGARRQVLSYYVW